MSGLVVGADGGNSKTDLVLARGDGTVLARVRGPGTRPYIDGIATTVADLGRLVDAAVGEAGLPPGVPIESGAFHLANVDLDSEQAEMLGLLSAAGVAARLEVRNDAFAILRAGSPPGWGIAVVSGAGINAVGVAPDGRTARFLGLGDISGDWGGGHGVGLAGLGAAIRAGDGRGPATTLGRLAGELFGVPGAEGVALAVHTGKLDYDDLHRLAPVVFAAAGAGDAVAAGILTLLADEVVTMATALLRRLQLLDAAAPVVLGGGTLQAGHAPLLTQIEEGLASSAPLATLHVLDSPPVTGALLAALDLVGAGASALARARAALTGAS